MISKNLRSSTLRHVRAVKMQIIFIYIFLLNFITVKSVCCRTFAISFVPKINEFGPCDTYVRYGLRHTEFTNGNQVRPGPCKVRVCNDGKPTTGIYCGKGPCNIFGCNCDGGCIEGDPDYPEDPVRNFMDYYSVEVDLATEPPTTTTILPTPLPRKCPGK
ncbi:uncharacterized protein LOC134650633 [Cydia amplana]|uniref:uncharacterized protein LOC134650633 n=1 Tax=Cydia amplana TaxID=1869771 RepID=UPI002FE52A73